MTALSASTDMVGDIITEPVFMKGNAGSIFCIRTRRINGHRVPQPYVAILVPPFAEEMNRSRRFFAKLRRELVHAGMAEVVQPDLYGTGDSAGDFSDASWDIWTSDLGRLATELRSQGYSRITLVGVRCGCLLIDEMTRLTDEPFTNIVFVQPETSGYDVVHHMLRVRVASRRFSGGASESTSELWKLLEKSEIVELSGYGLGGGLAMSMKDKRLDPMQLAPVEQGHWLELIEEVPGTDALDGSVTTDDSNQTPISSPVADSFEMNVGWSQHRLFAMPFWQLQEHEPADELINNIVRRVLHAS